ncbi:MAG TPA: hypothetical protein VGM72_05585 [Micropepsaceae bacterium]|jgi:hypothetical protein
MIARFASAEFLGANTSERLAKCRQMAEEASELAASATTEKQRASYLELVRQWGILAEEIERAGEPGQTGERNPQDGG